ncbi:MAG: DUF1570 domain-containing protein [Pirellulales bacterium]|nr:DUF1570 domain-containing protein [Pirellulales bacterium]
MIRSRRYLLAVLVSCVASAGCAKLVSRRLTLPAEYTVVREQLVIHSDFRIPSHHRLLEELSARRGDIVSRLGLPPSDEPIDVYLFENADQFGAFVRLHHPEFPLRRAFFLETDTRLQVYAQWGDRIAEDLRHEVTHGYLHSVVPNLPLWLDEGLAEYFEAPRGNGGLNRSQLEILAGKVEQGRWQPDLARLDTLQPSRDLSRDDYAESWAWVHFLLENPRVPRELIREYLHDLRRQGTTEPLSARVGRTLATPDQQLIAHVWQLAAS